jgi:ribose transport system ATP-binding protein
MERVAEDRTEGASRVEWPPNAVPLLRVEHISKQFPGTLALDDVTLDVRPSEVHVLFGENGAGKSTLIQIIAGVHRPTAGKILLRGEETVLRSVHHARNQGVSAVFQEFSIVPQLTVEQNLFLGSEFRSGPLLNKSALRRQAKITLERLGFPLKPEQRTDSLSRAEQQMVEIAKAFRTKPSIMILDEPTASLTDREANRLFALIQTLKEDGIGIIYITHRMNEIQRIGERISVLRDGKLVDTVQAAQTSDKQLVEMMTGRVVDQVFADVTSDPGDILLDVKELAVAGEIVKNVSIQVRAGEIVGVAGVVGSGKSNVGRAMFGLEELTGGKVVFRGETVCDVQNGLNVLSPGNMLDRGLYYVPSDRREEGLVMMQNVRENVSLSSLSLPAFCGRFFLRRQAEKKLAKRLAAKLDLSPPDIDRSVEYFSGGNQQKILMGKALTRGVKLFIFDEPTVGVDVAARMLIYKFIHELREAGAGILLISSDLAEILLMAQRTYVMHRGKLRAELSREETTEQNVLDQFFESEPRYADQSQSQSDNVAAN